MAPHIGITCDLDESRTTNTLPRTYVRAVLRAGGIPRALPIPEMEHTPGLGAPGTDRWEDWLSGLDGLLLSGGGDLDPALFGEDPLPALGSVDHHRDILEMALAREARRRGIPVLGICRGCQVLNVAWGGTVYQDLPSQRPEGLLQHRQPYPGHFASHAIAVREGSRLAAILGTTGLRVNSTHHQAVRNVAPGFEAVAWAPDGVIEAVEALEGSWTLGIQSHPERLESTSVPLRALFRAFVDAAASDPRNPAVCRPATAEDALPVARVQIDTWRGTYRGIVDDAFLDALLYAEAAERFRGRLADPGHELLVAEHSGRVVGFVGFGPSRDDDLPEHAGEVYALYVHPSHQGQGLGKALLQRAFTRLGERGCAPRHLWALKDNGAAWNFYRRQGGIPSGERMIRIGNQDLEEIRFLWTNTR